MNPLHILYLIAILLVLFLMIHSIYLIKTNKHNIEHKDIVSETLKKVDDVHTKVHEIHSKLT